MTIRYVDTVTNKTSQGKVIMEINGFTFSSRLIGTSACYHIAKRGNVVFTSKDMNYLIRKAKSHGVSQITGENFLKTK
jgi:hypothetical protein